MVAVPALFLNLTMVTDLCSIGTLFAFVLVCAGFSLAKQNGYSEENSKHVCEKNLFYAALVLYNIKLHYGFYY
jgi:hypothetical protein